MKNYQRLTEERVVLVQQESNMEKKEVFLKFCKINGITPLIMTRFYRKKPQLWIYNKKTCKYFLETVQFNDFFNCLSRSNSFYWLFKTISAKIFTAAYRNSKTYKRLTKKWTYFLGNNVFVQENSLKVGDKVLVTDWDSTKEGKVEEICVGQDNIRMSYFNETYNRICQLTTPFSTIVEINGKKPDIKYYIKYKRKVYGANS